MAKASAGAEAGIGAEVPTATPGHLDDYLTGKPVLDRPEERVRQVYLRRLVEEYGYPKEHIQTEFPIVEFRTGNRPSLTGRAHECPAATQRGSTRRADRR